MSNTQNPNATSVHTIQAHTIESLTAEIRAEYPIITRLYIRERKGGRKYVAHFNIGNVYLTDVASTLGKVRQRVRYTMHKHLTYRAS